MKETAQIRVMYYVTNKPITMLILQLNKDKQEQHFLVDDLRIALQTQDKLKTGRLERSANTTFTSKRKSL